MISAHLVAPAHVPAGMARPLADEVLVEEVDVRVQIVGVERGAHVFDDRRSHGDRLAVRQSARTMKRMPITIRY